MVGLLAVVATNVKAYVVPETTVVDTLNGMMVGTAITAPEDELRERVVAEAVTSRVACGALASKRRASGAALSGRARVTSKNVWESRRKPVKAVKNVMLGIKDQG